MSTLQNPIISALRKLSADMQGKLHTDDTLRTLYATDASAYREMPLAVAIPTSEGDLEKLIRFADKYSISLIPRAAGTSLAGQVVGHGIVVDISQHFNKILEVNTKEQWVRVQPGVVRDELNVYLKESGLFFGPETSTANRAMVGGMVGNNSCGANSVVYGSTREHLLEAKVFLSDGSKATFGDLDQDGFSAKCAGETASGLEQQLYLGIKEMLGDQENQSEIRNGYPKPSIPRRNTGYALDLLMDAAPFAPTEKPFNFCKLLAGSEGTLAFTTELKLHLNPLPPAHKGLLCAHFHTIDDALKANLIALEFNPSACELMDHYILECTKKNIEQRQNRFFVEGDPGAILVVELSRETEAQMKADAQTLADRCRQAGLGYHFPLVEGEGIKKVWTLRKAGLGLLSNLPGDAKPVAVIEDTAVDVNDLPGFIADFNKVLAQHNLFCVHYAHAGSGELHLRPIIDLKTAEGNALFRTIAEEIATLVKKYKGSLSGEHGDGRLRGEFIEFMIGPKNTRLLEALKNTWDPKHIFNPGKIVHTPAMNTSLRYMPNHPTPEINTYFNWSESQGVLRAAELCNGSGDCRKTTISGGTMCPSYMATRHEKDTTRARANILREMLTHSDKANPFDHEEIKEVMDLCLSCKGCKSECPSNVDMARLKAEFLQQYYDANGVPFRSQLVGAFTILNKVASLVPFLYNLTFTLPGISTFAKKAAGFAPNRSMPLLHKTTLQKWFKKRKKPVIPQPKGKVYLFCDEFTNYHDTDIGIKAVEVLEKLGYQVEIPVHLESARTYLSKGLVKKAKAIAIRNVELLKDIISAETPLIGIEPSAILSFKDEYPDLVHPYQKESAQQLANNCLLIDEFLSAEADKGNITSAQFTKKPRLIKLHGHCHQKALGSLVPTKKILQLPEQYTAQLIPSGCCGMAGSFGYEHEHYDLSMQIGELVLFPTVRKQPPEVLIAAPGTSCRHQIKDGTGRKALHPIEILYGAML